MADDKSEHATEKNQDTSDESIMHVRVQAPYKTYFDGEALSVSAKNDTGDFDVLGRHYNFISILSAGDIVIRKPDGEKETVSIKRGVMHVKKNELVVFLDV